jgi:CheY-like chemotaxis protein
VIRVLVVDDNEAIRRLVSKLLQHEGYAIDEAIDGLEALEKLDARSYDAVILDLMMPRATGFDVIAALRERNPGVLKKVVVLTAAMSKIDNEELNDVAGVVSKPFELDNLVTTVRDCIGAAR